MKPRRPLGERFREERRAAAERRVGPGVRRSPAALDAAVVAAVERLGPTSAYTIAAAVRTWGTPISEAQVYRVLTRLVERGEVDAITIGSRFMLASQDAGACALLLCSACGHVERVPAGECHHRLGELAAMTGFQIAKVVVEILGTCASCSSAQHVTAC